jgi:hypothetical protein
MIRSPVHDAYVQGEGTPAEFAKKVCVIVKEQGATLAN